MEQDNVQEQLQQLTQAPAAAPPTHLPAHRVTHILHSRSEMSVQEDNVQEEDNVQPQLQPSPLKKPLLKLHCPALLQLLGLFLLLQMEQQLNLQHPTALFQRSLVWEPNYTYSALAITTV